MIKMLALILGGGVGSRLFPLTYERSKPAVPIGGKYRLIDIPLSNCINSGVKRMFVLTQFNSASLNHHIKNSYNFDVFSNGFVNILAAEQTPSSDRWYQGTADAVRQSMHHFVEHDFDHFLILSGDQLYQMDFELMAKEHVANNADITIATIPVNADDATSFGIMKVDEQGDIPAFIEKPNSDQLKDWKSPVSPANQEKGKEYLASMGIYIFSRQALIKLFDDHEAATDFGGEIIPDAIKTNYTVKSYQYDGYWTDIGTIKSFFEANLALTDPIPEFDLFDRDRPIYTRGRMLAPAKFFGTTLWRAVVAEGAIIHAHNVDRSVIGLRSRIGERSKISNVFMLGADYYQTLIQIEADKNAGRIPMGVGNDCKIDHAILDKNCRIGDNVIIQGGPTLQDRDADEVYAVKDGIVVVKKNAVIPSGTRIGVV